MGIPSPLAERFRVSGFSTQRLSYQLEPKQLAAEAIRLGQAGTNSTGALVIDTGKFTGRSPKDRFIVRDSLTANTVDWGSFNQPLELDKFDGLLAKVQAYLRQCDNIWVRDVYACADVRYRVPVRVINEKPAHNLFVSNMFIDVEQHELQNFSPEWELWHAPGFVADPAVDGTRQGNFSVLCFERKKIVVGGTAYTGEMKKGVFSVLNFILPTQKNVFSMHCSANQGDSKDDVALFFGLSGTGKTTLSASQDRYLIGDDEHGWSDDSVFNFEGGCYAKCVNLTEEAEPFIFRAIREGALLENVRFYPGTKKVNYEDISVTENTRVSYPLSHIPNALKPSVSGIPKNIFFLTCDAFGILPPVAKLTQGQAMYHFLSGYTAKVAGTEEGVKEPSPVFSYCFGAPFLPLSPLHYAKMLGEKIAKYNVDVWFVNTGWTGGPYGVGERIKLKYTRAILEAVFSGVLRDAQYQEHSVFHFAMPTTCPGVPAELLNPSNTWADKAAYDKQTVHLAKLFHENFERYASQASADILQAQPKV